jgi:hypothetical protein
MSKWIVIVKKYQLWNRKEVYVYNFFITNETFHMTIYNLFIVKPFTWQWIDISISFHLRFGKKITYWIKFFNLFIQFIIWIILCNLFNLNLPAYNAFYFFILTYFHHLFKREKIRIGAHLNMSHIYYWGLRIT